MIFNNLGMAHVERGSLIEAAEYHAAARATFVRIGDRRGEIDALSSHAWVRLYQGAPEDTVRDLTIALDNYRSSGHTRNTVIALRGLAFAASDLGDHDIALGHARKAADLAQHSADLALCLNCVAWVHFRAGDFADAARIYRETVQQAESTSDAFQRTRALIGLGNAAAGQGDHAEAVTRWDLADESGLVLNPVVVGEGAARERLTTHFAPVDHLFPTGRSTSRRTTRKEAHV